MGAYLHDMQIFVNPDFARGALARVCTSCEPMVVQIHLRQIRDALGLTLEQVAERSAYSYSQLSRWETGKSNIPSGNLPDIARAYGCRIEAIFSGGEGVALSPIPSEEVLTALLQDVQQELPADLPFGAWPRSAASALHMRLQLLADGRTSQAGGSSAPEPAPSKGAQPRSPTTPAARA